MKPPTPLPFPPAAATTTLASPRSRATALPVAATLLLGAAFGFGAADAAAAPPGKAARPAAAARAAKAPVRAKPTPRKAAVALPAVLPAADGEQLAAAGVAHRGAYDCEFGQTVEVRGHDAAAGYLDVRLGPALWVMKPVMSSTGALRLEDVRGRMLMLQIANKSMLMDTQVGRRIVDDCVHASQLQANRDAKAAGDASGPILGNAAPPATSVQGAPPAAASATAAGPVPPAIAAATPLPPAGLDATPAAATGGPAAALPGAAGAAAVGSPASVGLDGAPSTVPQAAAAVLPAAGASAPVGTGSGR